MTLQEGKGMKCGRSRNLISIDRSKYVRTVEGETEYETQ